MSLVSSIDWTWPRRESGKHLNMSACTSCGSWATGGIADCWHLSLRPGTVFVCILTCRLTVHSVAASSATGKGLDILHGREPGLPIFSPLSKVIYFRGATVVRSFLWREMETFSKKHPLLRTSLSSAPSDL